MFLFTNCMTLKNISLTKISFTISLLGIFFLLFLANTLHPKLTNISEISSKNLNQQIEIQGQITSIKNFEQYKFQLITIKDSSGKINAVVNYEKYPLNLTTNQEVILIGKVIQYNKEYQIQSEKISLKN